MKKIVTILAVLLQMSLLGHAQYYSNPELSADQKEALRKVEQYAKVKGTGVKLLVGGAAATITGVVLMSNAEFYTDNMGNLVSDDPNFGRGFFAILLVGVPLIATGTTLTAIGASKEKSYMRKLDHLSVSYFNQHGANGFRLAYNF